MCRSNNEKSEVKETSPQKDAEITERSGKDGGKGVVGQGNQSQHGEGGGVKSPLLTEQDSGNTSRALNLQKRSEACTVRRGAR